MIIKGDIKYKQQKGKGVYYQIPNLRYEEQTSLLKFDSFKFFTPAGDLRDGEGFYFFQVQADEIPIERDTTYNKEIFVIINRGTVDYYPVFLHSDAVGLSLKLGQDSELMAKINIPVNGEIIIEFFESEV